MHILIIISHPDKNSFTHAIAQRFSDGANAAGHTTEFGDLHAEGFDPRWTIADIGGDAGEKMPADIIREQQRVEKCDAVCMAFPLFWFGMPAMLKGWLERVWSWGWAYDQLDDHNKSLQKPRTAVLLVPAGANPDAWEPYSKIEEAMRNIWSVGTLGYFGFKNKDIHILNGATGSEKRRKSLLDQAYEAGLEMEFPNDSRPHQCT